MSKSTWEKRLFSTSFLFLSLFILTGGFLGGRLYSQTINDNGENEAKKGGETAQLRATDATTDEVKLSELSNSEKYSNLPVADIDTHKVDGSKGKIVLIPQTHRSPGSDRGDQVNDKAKIAQKQIYEVLSHINDSFGIDKIMTEGKLIGGSKKDKVKSMRKMKDLRDDFVADVEKLKKESKENNEYDPGVFSEFEQFIDKIDRELYLAGAPYLLKAENKSVDILGVEDKKLRQKSKKIVRNYLYQKDRIQDLKRGNSSGLSLSSNSLSSKKQKLAKLMELLDSGEDSKPEVLEAADTLADKVETEDAEIKKAISSVEKSYQDIKEYYNEKKQEDKLEGSSSNDNPSREDNPYDNIDDLGKMKQIHKNTKKKISEVIKNKRNGAVAKNVNKHFNSKSISSGVLVFGAQHEEGLVKELNKKGYSVVVVTPEIVNR